MRLSPTLVTIGTAACVFLGALPAHALVWYRDTVKSASGLTLEVKRIRKPITRKIKTFIPNVQQYILRNNQRRSDVKKIATAFFEYQRDHGHVIPKSIPQYSAVELCRFTARSCTGLIDVQDLLEDYLPDMPVDPGVTDGNGTGYFIQKDRKDRVTVTAPNAESNWIIKESK